jgi:DNA-binding NtrC family response regulator
MGVANVGQPKAVNGVSSGTSSASLVVIDDDPTIHELLGEVFEPKGYQIHHISDGAQSIHRMMNRKFDVVLLDLKLGPTDGHAVLKAIKSTSPEAPVIMMSAYGQISDAVSALKQGAFDFLIKPFSIDQLIETVERALEESAAVKAVQQPSQETSYQFHRILGRSPVMQEIYETLRLVAPNDANVLIEGESGTGKELVAEAIHHFSRRAAGPLIKLNCAAIPRDLLESELFGHERGAFTGAHRRRIGHFERANGGTLMLDEIGEIDPLLQAKLLRAIEEKEFQPLGSERTVKVDVRILAATNRDLESGIREGRFRKDLYFRLQTVRVRIPPLRERKEDIPLLARYFVRLYGSRVTPPVTKIANEAMEELLSASWPGNVRELENTIEHAVIFAKGGVITPASFRGQFAKAKNGTSNTAVLRSAAPLQDIEKEAIVMALEVAEGSLGVAANLLGIHRTTLYRKMKFYNMTWPVPKAPSGV